MKQIKLMKRVRKIEWFEYGSGDNSALPYLKLEIMLSLPTKRDLLRWWSNHIFISESTTLWYGIYFCRFWLSLHCLMAVRHPTLLRRNREMNEIGEFGSDVALFSLSIRNILRLNGEEGDKFIPPFKTLLG